MHQLLKTISLPMPLKLGRVNCYLAQARDGFVLIDTGGANARRVLEAALEEAGCMPGNLKLIVITHGDFDHIGNAAYLRRKYNAPIAMHPDDAGMADKGDMFWNRKTGSRIFRILARMLFRFGKENRFKPDIVLGDEDSLGEYGMDATIFSIPGHSRGSIGVLTAAGDLFCGDLFDNTHTPVLNAIMDELEMAHASVAKLSKLVICCVYPGHGKPFHMEDYSFANQV
jgi:glyoxylase-like metal-dependent hydrolase (beta-lactamase superfamily II)